MEDIVVSWPVFVFVFVLCMNYVFAGAQEDVVNRFGWCGGGFWYMFVWRGVGWGMGRFGGEIEEGGERRGGIRLISWW